MAWTAPDNFWLLAPAVLCQAVGLVRLAVFSRFGLSATSDTHAPRWAVGLVAVGALLGLAYALITRDLVFAAGQVGMLLLAWVACRTA